MTLATKNCEENELPDETLLGARCLNTASKEVLPVFFHLFLQNNFETEFQPRDLQYPQLGCCDSLSCRSRRLSASRAILLGFDRATGLLRIQPFALEGLCVAARSYCPSCVAPAPSNLLFQCNLSGRPYCVHAPSIPVPLSW